MVGENGVPLAISPENRPKGSVVCLAQVEGLGSPVNNDP